MTALEAFTIARASGCRVELDGDVVRVHGPEDVFECVIARIRPAKDSLRAVLQEHRALSASDAVRAAAMLLRHGAWQNTCPEDCGLFIGPPNSETPCPRCGLYFDEHCAPPELRPMKARERAKKQRGAA